MILAVNGEHIETSRGLIRSVAAASPGSNCQPFDPPAGP